jgi:hypothetical protein
MNDGTDATPSEVIDAVVLAVRNTPQERDLRMLRTTSPFAMYAGVAAVVAIVAVAGVSALYALGLGPTGGFVPSGDPTSPFHGTWVSTSDTDGGAQTMTVGVSTDGAVEIVVHDDVATVCSGTPSTMTGTGRIGANSQLVIPEPVYTCDDGSEAESLSGPPLAEQLRDWTLVLDPGTDTLTDNLGGLWLREGADPTETISDTTWPQSRLEEVQEAQRLADAGDPDYAWQVDAQLVGDVDVDFERLSNGQVELVDRFLREVLGWEAYMLNGFAGGAGSALTDLRFLRCAPGRTNPLYPPQPDSNNPGESCAPTLDELTYEAVRLDLAQPGRQGPGGIWVVARWSETAPFEQADPAVTEAQATQRLEEFLAARIAGRGAEGYVDVYADWLGQDGETCRDANCDVPLLYATTSGAPYERFEFERVSGPRWPYGGYITYSVRLFADDGATVVDQRVDSHWDGGASVGIVGGLGMSSMTTENGQPVSMRHAQFDGEVTYSSPSPSSWAIGEPGNDTLLDFTDPALFWSDNLRGLPNCGQGPVPADAAAFAQAVIADPDFETTPPVAARVGGVDAVVMDVALSPAGRVCGPYRTDVHQWINSLVPGKRLRLFLVDVPEGMSMQTLAITVMAPAAHFDEVIADATPIIDSIEFHPD